MTAKIKLNAASGGGSVSLEAPTSTTGNANVEFKLPVADGTSGQALTTNASGQLAFATISSNPTTTSGTDNFTIADGNLVIGTSGHGIDFSAQTAAGSAYTKDSELLDHYEEGTFTPNISSPQLNSVQLPAFTDASFERRNGNYIKIGRFVAFNAEIQMHASTRAFANGDGTQTLAITGCFPFAKSTSTRPAASPCAIKFSGNSTFNSETLYADATSHFSPPFIRVFKIGSGGLVGQNINSIFQTSSFVIISGFYMADA